jgi:cell division protein ZapA
MAEPRVVHIEVHGQSYPIRTNLEAAYVAELARFVERKMALAAQASPSSDTLGLAVLTALNVADELFRALNERGDEVHSITTRAAALERMVDQALQLVGHRE